MIVAALSAVDLQHPQYSLLRFTTACMTYRAESKKAAASASMVLRPRNFFLPTAGPDLKS